MDIDLRQSPDPAILLRTTVQYVLLRCTGNLDWRGPISSYPPCRIGCSRKRGELGQVLASSDSTELHTDTRTSSLWLLGRVCSDLADVSVLPKSEGGTDRATRHTC